MSFVGRAIGAFQTRSISAPFNTKGAAWGDFDRR